MEIVEESERALEAIVVRFVPRRQTFDELLHAERFRAPELVVLEVEVVHDLRERLHAAVGETDAADERLDRAAIAGVSEVAADHIEPQFVSRGGRSRHVETEARFRSVEASEEIRGS